MRKVSLCYTPVQIPSLQIPAWARYLILKSSHPDLQALWNAVPLYDIHLNAGATIQNQPSSVASTAVAAAGVNGLRLFGLAKGSTIFHSFLRNLRTNPKSHFGGVLAKNGLSRKREGGNPVGLLAKARGWFPFLRKRRKL